MTSSPSEAVARFKEHAETHRDITSDKAKTAALPSALRDERAALIDGLLESLGLSAAELVKKLGIGRATWDRWRYMTASPSVVMLEHLERFAAQKEDHVGRTPTATQLDPNRLLGSSPHTWGRIKLAYSVYPWNSAIFKFQTSFANTDAPDFALDIALLAFKGCRIIFIMPMAEKWCTDFISIVARAVGRTDSARMLGRICTIEITEEQSKIGLDYAFFNYEEEDHQDRVGYIWKRKWTDENPKSKPPSIYEDDVFTFVFGDDYKTYGELATTYKRVIDLAMNQITTRSEHIEQGLFQRQVSQDILQIPVVNFKSEKITLVEESSVK